MNDFVTTPAVSVIATFWNLEAYVERCVSSVLAQTHRCEVILVDDGSTDGTLGLLKGFERYPNVKVITRDNGGPGAARNTGVANAKGDFVAFVDGDDELEPNFVELMVAAQVESGKDLIIAEHRVVRDGDKTSVSDDIEPEYSYEVVDQLTAVDWLLAEKVTESPWSKLIRRSLVEAHPFPENCYYEDVAIAGEWYIAANGIALVNVPLYRYTMRRNSVVHRRVASPTQVDDFVKAIDKFLVQIERSYPEKKAGLAYRRMLEYARLHSVISVTEDEPNRMADLDWNIRKEIRTLFPQARGYGFRKGNMLRFALLSWAPRLYDAVFSIYEDRAKKIQRGNHSI